VKDPKEEEHIEELLSQLQGIFGKLSKTEEEESQTKNDLPSPSAIEPILATVPTPEPSPSPVPVPDPVPPAPAFVFTELNPEPKFELEPALVLAAPIPTVTREDPFALRPPPVQSEPPLSDLLPVTPTGPITASPAPVMAPPAMPPILDPSTIGCAIYYPALREKEAKTLAQKIETMTPKFTKVAFKLQVTFIVSYDPRSDWRDSMIERARQNNVRAVFLITERLLDDPKRRALQTELDGYHIYFQEVPNASIEKKAFFTDVLLGMVFFFDSLKPKPSGE
jgi:hypothetical protein